MTPEPVEIERKWLLRGVPGLPDNARAYRLEQGYLPDEADADAGTDALQEGRLRRVTGQGIRRTEIERDITVEEFERQWPRTAGARLTKTRYKVPEPMGGIEVVWELDVFDGLDLVLLEVELPSECVPVELPPWLAAHVDREVTDDPAYRNFAIARRAVLNAGD